MRAAGVSLFAVAHGAGLPAVSGRAKGCAPIRRRNVRLILLILVILLLLGALPTWPYSHSWGYYPSGGLGLIVLIILLVMVFGGRDV
jgi:hypothetical protein